jgi:hypothetical protein
MINRRSQTVENIVQTTTIADGFSSPLDFKKLLPLQATYFEH